MKALMSKQKVVNRVLLIPIDKVHPNPNQPRKIFDEEKINQLAASIAQYGLLQPITVTQTGDGEYQIVAGERRLMACKRLRLGSIAAIQTEMNEEKSSALALIENIQRCDLNFFEEAAAIQRLMEMMGQTQQVVAKRLGKNQSTIANKLRLLQFSPQVRQSMTEAGLTERHARALLPLIARGEQTLLEAVAEIRDKQFNVAQTEQFVQLLTQEQQEQPKPKKTNPHRLFIVKDLKIFINSIDRAIQTMKLSGIEAKTEMEEQEDCLVYTVKIPKKSAYQERKQKSTGQQVQAS